MTPNGNQVVGFLTSKEWEDLNTPESKWDNVGEIKAPPSYGDLALWHLAKQFKHYPVRWANSSDRLYSLPYEDDLLTALSKEKMKRQEEDAQEGKTWKPNAEPWTYQDGAIWYARLVRQSPKAWLINLKGFGTTWVPKSQVDFPEPYREIWLPVWLMKDKGLTFAEAPPELNPPFEWEPALLPKKEGVGE